MEHIKNEIKSNINKILNFDLEKIYEKGNSKEAWNEYLDKDLKSYIINILNILKKIQKIGNNFFITIGINYLNELNLNELNLNELNNHLVNIINSYNNSGIIDIDINHITSHHHDLLNHFKVLNTFLRQNGVYNETNYSSELSKKTNLEYEKLYELLNLISRNKEKYEKAIPELDKIIERQGTINTTAIKGQADAFFKRAEDHVIKIFSMKINYWFFFILIFSAITFSIVYFFIPTSDQNISIGQSILKIASLLVPAYLTIFSANQYLYHKRMNETYMFKNTSLETMNYLISQNPDIKNEILTKGLEVLFSEPAIEKKNSKENKLIIPELLSMLKGQLKN